MEVYIKGVPERVTENKFSKFIRPALSALNIFDWQVQKRPGKNFAHLTFLSIGDGQRFLARHGRGKDNLREHLPSIGTDITYFAVPLFCTLSHRQPDPL